MRQAAKQTPLGLTKRPPLIVTQRRASKAPVAFAQGMWKPPESSSQIWIQKTMVS
jgi:hypothetical protein